MSKKDKYSNAKLIVNPEAGNPKEGTEKLDQAIRSLQANGIQVDVAIAHPKEEARAVAKKALKKGYQLVIAMGGDGTLEAIMGAMVGSKASLGIIPAGSQNNVAKSLGIPLDIEQACALIAGSNLQKLDIGQARLKDGRKHYFFELAAIGLAAAIYPDANKITNGKLEYIKDAALTFIHQEAHPEVKITLDDESKIAMDSMLVVVSNTPIFGQNFLIAPQASLQDGLLDVALFPEFSKAELVAYFARIRHEGYYEDPKIQRYRARKVEIKASPKQDVMADGLVLGKGTVEIKIRPAALWIIAPEVAPALPAAVQEEEMLRIPLPVPVTGQSKQQGPEVSDQKDISAHSSPEGEGRP